MFRHPVIAALRKHLTISAMLVAEVAVACVILCNAAILIVNCHERMSVKSGIVENGIVEIAVDNGGSDSEKRARTLGDEAIIREVPGVQSVASTGQLPLSGSSWTESIGLERDKRTKTTTVAIYAGERFLETVGSQLVAGRYFYTSDYVNLSHALDPASVDHPSVAVITEALARHLWTDGEGLGRTIYFNGEQLTVVGILRTLVKPDDIRSDSAFSLVLPIRVDEGQYVVRTDPGQRARVLQDITARMLQSNPHRLVIRAQPWSAIRKAFFKDDARLSVMLEFTCAALLLVTGAGIGGLASFWVSQRRRQIGVRRALGATRSSILAYFQLENFFLVGLGLVAGSFLAVGVNVELILLYAIPQLHIIYLLAGIIPLLVTGQIAVALPALQAMRIAPVTAIRD